MSTWLSTHESHSLWYIANWTIFSTQGKPPVTYGLYKTISFTTKNYRQPPMLFIVTWSKVLLFSLDVLSPCETMDDYKKVPVDVYISTSMFLVICNASFSSGISQSARMYWEFHPAFFCSLHLEGRFVIRQSFCFPSVFLWSVKQTISWMLGDMVASFQESQCSGFLKVLW